MNLKAQRDLSVGRDIVGRDVIEGDKVEGDKITHIHHYGEKKERPAPRMAPPAPRVFIGRDEVLHELIAALKLGDEGAGPIALTALKGMGGIGKTTLAAALANHPEVETALPDGTLWAGLGPEPEVMSLLAEWGTQLGEDFAQFDSPETRSRRLSTLLHDKKALLIVDDVWDVEPARYFLVGGPHCRALITTRDNDVARKLAGHEAVRIETLTNAASLNLLRELAPEAVAVDEKAANELATVLDGLPLALTLAGQMLAAKWEAGLGVVRALSELKDRKKARLKLAGAEKRPGLATIEPSLRAILAMSYDRLPDEAAKRAFRLLGAFGGKPLTFSFEAAAAIWEMELLTAEDIMVALVGRALVEPVDRGRYTLHTTLADFAESLIDEHDETFTAQQAHARYFLDLAQKNLEIKQQTEIEQIRRGFAWALSMSKDEKMVLGYKQVFLELDITPGLPVPYRVATFVKDHLSTEENPLPFGGRASDLDALDAWLEDPAAPPYTFLIAPAGRGKSTLLVHWITHLAARYATSSEAIHVVYFPISIGYETNLETLVFASLAARLAYIYGERVTPAMDPEIYRGVFSEYLRRTPPNGRVLVVLDGLDEAAGWEAGADLFPTVPPSFLRVLVAARPLAGEIDATAWLNRLGWEMPNRVQCISLSMLDDKGVRDILGRMGSRLNALVEKNELVNRLYELSEGDPLLVRLYVEALLAKGAAATLTLDDFTKLQPSLEAYFKSWLEEQQKLWGNAKPLEDETVRTLLNLCAVAFSPLKKDDVLALAPDIFDDSGVLDEAVAAVKRFIIGDGLTNGYAFSYPRLGKYFEGKLSKSERDKVHARFLQYGRDTLASLENETLDPKDAPAYIVKYYCAHLEQAEAAAADFYALVCESWLRVWEWLEGTPTGFLNDAHRARHKAETEGAVALGQQIRAICRLVSGTSLSASISKELIATWINVRELQQIVSQK